ncbi:MAG TPA: hypothetical protein VHT05_13580 [Candidatus Elarobacter sp.]|jgi:hypothetical protein|nr:hypothetical protein [Candidatus Elarobacter sp.]
MKAIRLAALIAVPAAFLLSACAGGSSGIIGGGGGVPGQQGNVRFVNAYNGPGNATASYDIYFQSNGSASPSSPLIGALTYGEASDFKPLPNVSGSVIVQTAGGPAPSTSSPQITSCPVPQFSNNTNYSIVIAYDLGVVNCILFQDSNYNGSANQYRFHDASHNAVTTIGGTVAQGVTSAPGVPGTSTFAVLGTTQIGTAATQSGGATSYPVITPSTMASTAGVSFAIGPNSGATATATTTLDAQYLMLPGSNSQPNAGGSNNFTLPSGSYAGASIYAIDCGTAALPAGSHCVNGVGLIGVFDTH